MHLQRTLSCLAATLLSFSGAGAEAMEPASRDPICDALLKQYILVQGKIPTVDVDAAIQLVASRGANRGYDLLLLEELKTNHACQDKIMHVLSKMLGASGGVRFYRSRPAQAQFPSASPVRPNQHGAVVKELLARAQRAEGNELHRLVFALRNAWTTEAKALFEQILKEPHVRPFPASGSASPPKVRNVPRDTRFVAAVALAELGEPSGFAWLMEASVSPLGQSVFHNGHLHGHTDRAASCRFALQDLTGEKLTSKVDAKRWLQQHPNGFAAKQLAMLKDK